jgi:cell division septation protein DedD
VIGKHSAIACLVLVAVLVMASLFVFSHQKEAKVHFNYQNPPPLPTVKVKGGYNLKANSFAVQSPPHSDDFVAAWVLSVASYESEQRAKTMLHQLQQASFNAFLVPSASDNKLYYRLYVGPFSSKTEANTRKLMIQKRFIVTPVLLDYDVEQY